LAEVILRELREPSASSRSLLNNSKRNNPGEQEGCALLHDEQNKR